MSRNFDGSTTDLRKGSATPYTVPMTVSAWIKPDVAVPLVDHIIWLQSDSTGDELFKLQLEGSSSTESDRGKIRWVSRAGAVSSIAQTTTGVSADVWHHVCGVEASTTDRRVFIDGGSKGTDTTSSTPGTIQRIRVGVAELSASDFFDGDISQIAIWDVALTDAEIASLAAGVSPLRMRRDSLVAYWPIGGNQDPEPNIIGSGANELDVRNAPPKTEEPPVPWTIRV